MPILTGLKYAHENGCEWDSRTTVWASQGGHLECLEYARENGCPWSSWGRMWAREKGYLKTDF